MLARFLSGRLGKDMNINGYLSLKYDVSKATTITKREAKILGIPFPLRKGWLLLHGPREISESAAAQLAMAMEARAKRTASDNCRSLAMAGKSASQIAQQQAKWEPKAIDGGDEAFLLSYEWRRIRMQALKKYGARCQCCGATASDGVRLHVDHIKPRKLFPALALDIENLQVLCEECNHGKGNWDMTDWRNSIYHDNKDLDEYRKQIDHLREIIGED